MFNLFWFFCYTVDMPMPVEKGPEKPVVVERAEDVGPLNIEHKEVVTPTPSRFSGQVYSQSGQPLITTPENKEVTVILPADPAAISAGTKGSTDDSQTWFFVYWLRALKQALLSGHKLAVKK